MEGRRHRPWKQPPSPGPTRAIPPTLTTGAALRAFVPNNGRLLRQAAIGTMNAPPIIKLRPYQIAALAALHAHLQSSTSYPLISMATGTGKSLVIAAAVQQIAQQYPNVRFLILAPRLELIEQEIAAIKALWSDAPVGIVCEGLDRRDWQARIVVGTVNSIYRCPEKLGPRNLIFVDEAHLIPSGDEGMFQAAFSALLNQQPALRIIGLTATPFRLDSGKLDEGDDRLFDSTIFSYGIGAGIADGWLAPLIAKAPNAQSRSTPPACTRSPASLMPASWNVLPIRTTSSKPPPTKSCCITGGGSRGWCSAAASIMRLTSAALCRPAA
jgi:superfamily II DNA or RNA helicase